jgi:hypothetical protein
MRRLSNELSLHRVFFPVNPIAPKVVERFKSRSKVFFLGFMESADLRGRLVGWINSMANAKCPRARNFSLALADLAELEFTQDYLLPLFFEAQ